MESQKPKVFLTDTLEQEKSVIIDEDLCVIYSFWD